MLMQHAVDLARADATAADGSDATATYLPSSTHLANDGCVELRAHQEGIQLGVGAEHVRLVRRRGVGLRGARASGATWQLSNSACPL